MCFNNRDRNKDLAILMSSDSLLTGDQQRYAKLHQGADAVQRYQRKLDNRLDHLRHQVELNVLARLLSGRVFDCTIGIGRFIGHLPHVEAYDGMDMSEEFVDFVRNAYPASRAFVADILQTLPLEDASYDSVLCLRSLSGIGNLEKILPEMVRVTRPGGLIIFDYGRRATAANVKGVRTVLDGDDLGGIVSRLEATLVERVYVDAILTRAKIYNRVFRFINGPRGRIVSDQLLMKMENWTAPWLWQRQIVVLKKPIVFDYCR